MKIKERLQILNDIADGADLLELGLIEYNIENAYAVFESRETREFYSAEVTREKILVGDTECEDAPAAIRELHVRLIADKKEMARIENNIKAVEFYDEILQMKKVKNYIKKFL